MDVIKLADDLQPILTGLPGHTSGQLGILISAAILAALKHDPELTPEEVKAALLGAEQSVAAYATTAREMRKSGTDSIQ